MSTRNKLIQRFLFQPQTIGIEEVRALLKSLGYEEKKSPGSECLFHKKGAYPINVPTVQGRKVRKVYVQRLAATLNLEEIYEQGGD